MVAEHSPEYPSDEIKNETGPAMHDKKPVIRLLRPSSEDEKLQKRSGFLLGRLGALRLRASRAESSDKEEWTLIKNSLLKLAKEANENPGSNEHIPSLIASQLSTARDVLGEAKEAQPETQANSTTDSNLKSEERDEDREARERNLAQQRRLEELDAQRAAERAAKNSQVLADVEDSLNPPEDGAAQGLGEVSAQFENTSDVNSPAEQPIRKLVRGEPITPRPMERARSAVANHRLGDRAVDTVKDIPSTLKQDFKDNFAAMKQDAAAARQTAGENAAQIKQDLKKVTAAPGAALDAFNSTVLANHINETIPSRETIFTQEHADAAKAAPRKVGSTLNAARKGIGQAVASDVSLARKGLKEFMVEGLEYETRRRAAAAEEADASGDVDGLDSEVKSVADDQPDSPDSAQKTPSRVKKIFSKEHGQAVVSAPGKALGAVESTVLMNRINDAIPKSEDIFTKENTKKALKKSGSVAGGLLKDSGKTGARGLRNIAMLGTNFAVTEAKGVRNLAVGDAKGVANIAKVASLPARKGLEFVRNRSNAAEPESEQTRRIREAVADGRVWGANRPEGPRRSPVPEDDDPVAYKFNRETPKADDPAKPEQPKFDDSDLDKLGLDAKDVYFLKKRRSSWRSFGFTEQDIENYEVEFAQAERNPDPKKRAKKINAIEDEIKQHKLEFRQRGHTENQPAAEAVGTPAINTAENRPAPGERAKTPEELEAEKKIKESQVKEKIASYSDQIQALLDNFPAAISKELIAYRQIKKAGGKIDTFIDQEKASLKDRRFSASEFDEQVLLRLKELWANLMNDFARVSPGLAGRVQMDKELADRLAGKQVRRIGQSEFEVNKDPDKVKSLYQNQEEQVRKDLLEKATKYLEPAVAEQVNLIISNMEKGAITPEVAHKLIQDFNSGEKDGVEHWSGKHPNEPVTSTYIIQVGKDSGKYVNVIRNRLGEVFLQPMTPDKAVEKLIPPKDRLVNVDDSYVGRQVQSFDMKYLAGHAMGFDKDVAVYVKLKSGQMMKLSQRGRRGEIVVEDAGRPGQGEILKLKPKKDRANSEDEFELGHMEVGKSFEFKTDKGMRRTEDVVNEIIVVYTNTHDLLNKTVKSQDGPNSRKVLGSSHVLGDYHKIERAVRGGNRRFGLF